MNLQTYEIFNTVVMERSFQKASLILNLTPSAISHAISAMEKELGLTLFTRSRSGVALTSSGELLIPYVHQLLSSNDAFFQAVAEINGLKKGLVRVGAFNSVCSNWLPKIIHSFSKEYPGIDFEIYQGSYEDISQWIKNGTIDFGFLSSFVDEAFYFYPLYKDPLLCVVPKGFSTQHKDYITIEEIRTSSLVSQRAGCDADVQALLQKYSLSIRSNCYVMDDLSTISMVRSGFGICIMPELTMDGLHHDVDLYPIEPKEYRIIGLACHKTATLTPVVKKVMEFIKHLTF